MDIFAQIARKIIEEQENIIGPVVLEQAKKVQGLRQAGMLREKLLQRISFTRLSQACLKCSSKN